MAHTRRFGLLGRPPRRKRTTSITLSALQIANTRVLMSVLCLSAGRAVNWSGGERHYYALRRAPNPDGGRTRLSVPRQRPSRCLFSAHKFLIL